MSKLLLLSALLTGTVQAQIVIYTNAYGQPAGAAFVQGNMQPQPYNSPPNYQVVSPTATSPVPQFNPAPSVPSSYYINPQGASNERK
jgi:hypothetical protein